MNPGMSDWGGVGAPPLGSSDLDPLGGILGGGMIMDPRQGDRMGQPVHPRFDQVGPGMGGIGPLGRGMEGGMVPLEEVWEVMVEAWGKELVVEEEEETLEML